MRAVLVLLACAILLPACPRDDAGDSSGAERAGSPEDPDGHALTQSDEELLRSALGSELPDERHFAMLAISTYKLHAFEDDLRALTGDDPVAACVLAAVHGDPDILREFFISQPPGQRVGQLLGAVYGLGSAADVPAATWVGSLTSAAEEELDALLWGLAQLDVEPGGPLQLSDDLVQLLEDEQARAVESGSLYRRGALDALLGGQEGYRVDWEAYLPYVSQSHWNGVQWAALLRWADADVWQRILGLSGVHEAIQLELARAVVLVGPAETVLPGSEGRLKTMGMGREYQAVKFMNGRLDTMPLDELETLAGEADDPATGTEDEAEYRRQAYDLALSDTLVMLDYALIRGDQLLVDRVMDAFPELLELARSGMLATIMRRRPAALSDERLSELIALDDRTVGYFLLLGWYEREVVQRSSVYTLVRNSPGHENALIAAGYHCWLEQSGL